MERFLESRRVVSLGVVIGLLLALALPAVAFAYGDCHYVVTSGFYAWGSYSGRFYVPSGAYIRLLFMNTGTATISYKGRMGQVSTGTFLVSTEADCNRNYSPEVPNRPWDPWRPVPRYPTFWSR